MMKLDLSLTSQKRSWLVLGSVLYLLALFLMCWTPQLSDGLPTPGIQRFGRLVVLLVPFNSLVNLGQVTSGLQLAKVILQNIANILLLLPLVYQLIWLFPDLRKVKRVLRLGFYLSLGIELGQLLLDYLWDFNRVFELDDLWTNTLGAYLALGLYRKLTAKDIEGQ